MKYTQEQIQEEYNKVQEAWGGSDKDKRILNVLAGIGIPLCIGLVKYGHEGLISEAVKAGANPNVQDACGNTALHMAYLCNKRAIDYLNLLDVDSRICNDKGEIPGDWEMLLQHELLNMNDLCHVESLGETGDMDGLAKESNLLENADNSKI